MARALHPFQRRTAIYNAVCDLHARSLEGNRIDSAAAWLQIQRVFPDITKTEFLQAAQTVQPRFVDYLRLPLGAHWRQLLQDRC